MAGETQTTLLLRRWDNGDEEALNLLLGKHLNRIRSMVRSGCRQSLRNRVETEDIVQQSILSFLRYGPPIKPVNGRQFRRLMSKIVEHSILDVDKWFSVRRQQLASIGSDEVLDLDQLEGVSVSPDQIVAQRELVNRVRFALEFVDPLSRELYLSQQIDGLQLIEIGQKHDLSADAVRMRISRLKERLKELMKTLRTSDLDSWLTSLENQEDLSVDA